MLQAWRKLPEHRAMRKLGRESYFADYRLRVAKISCDYGLESRNEAPADSQLANP